MLTVAAPAAPTVGVRPQDAWVAAGVFVLALLVYTVTMYPDVTGGDAGELIAAVTSGGVIHPPGFPLYALLGRMFLHLGAGTPAWRLNLMSGVFDAAAASLLFLAVNTWTRARWAGLAAASLFAFSPGVWRYAIGAEVFALNNFFVALLILLAILYDRSRERRYAHAGALAFGLALCDQQTIVFTGLPLAVWVLWTGRSDLLPWRSFSRLVALFVAGLVPYLVLVFDGAHRVAATWGATNTWSGFWTHVLRGEYGTLRLARPDPSRNASSMNVVYDWALDLVREAGWWGLLIALIGLIGCLAAARRRPVRLEAVVVIPPFLAVGVFAVLSQRPYDDPFAQAVLARFWQQPDLFVFLLCGYALALAEGRFPRRSLVPAVCVALALLQPVLHFGELDHRKDTVVRQYGAEILRAAPRGSLLVTQGDLITFVLRYLQVAEGVRTDVRVIDPALVAFPWERERLAGLYPEIRLPDVDEEAGADSDWVTRELVALNVNRFPTLVCGAVHLGDTSLADIGAWWPLGRCQALVRRGHEVSVDAWVRESGTAMTQIDFGSREAEPGTPEDMVRVDYWLQRYVRAYTLLQLSGTDDAGRGYARLAGELLDDALRQDPRQSPDTYKLLAMALDRARASDAPGERQKVADAWRNYLRVAPSSDREVSRIEEEVARLSR